MGSLRFVCFLPERMVLSKDGRCRICHLLARTPHFSVGLQGLIQHLCASLHVHVRGADHAEAVHHTVQAGDGAQG